MIPLNIDWYENLANRGVGVIIGKHEKREVDIPKEERK